LKIIPPSILRIEGRVVGEDVVWSEGPVIIYGWGLPREMFRERACCLLTSFLTLLCFPTHSLSDRPRSSQSSEQQAPPSRKIFVSAKTELLFATIRVSNTARCEVTSCSYKYLPSIRYTASDHMNAFKATHCPILQSR
jgi:hypothetical protein